MSLDERKYAADPALYLQESLSATFAAGLPSACVIDIGACKTSISCIDEGMVINDSRMVMDFGSDDVIETFTQLMKTIDFPFKEVDLSRPVDWEMMQELFSKAGAFNEVRALSGRAV
jgi:actin-related protein 8